MAAPARVSEHKLEDKIRRLLKLSDIPEMKHMLEEAAQVSTADQHREDVAPAEKAEAIRFLPAPPATAAAADQSFAGRMATDLANGLTQVLVRAMQDLERHVSTESERLGSTFGQRLDRLQSSMEALQPLHHRIEQLFQSGAAVQKKVDELAAATTSWGEAHARLDNDVAALRLQMDQLSATMSTRVDDVCRRVEAQEREISTIQANASELASKMAVAAERLEKHATAIRSLHDSHRQRTEVFGQMGELLHRLNHGPAATEGNAL